MSTARLMPRSAHSSSKRRTPRNTSRSTSIDHLSPTRSATAAIVSSLVVVGHGVDATNASQFAFRTHCGYGCRDGRHRTARHAARRAAAGRRRGPRRHPDHVLAEGVHPADDAVSRPLRLLHVRRVTGPRRDAVPRARRPSLRIATAGARAGCHEALFTLGERPELRYPVARDWLRDHGYAIDRRLPRRRCAGWCSRRPGCCPTPTPAP